MTVNEVKAHIDSLVKEYFAGAHVVWAGQSMVHRGNPAVILRLRNVQTAVFPVTSCHDGEITDSYPATAILEVNLFTDGKVPAADKNILLPRENTAVNDLTGLQLFLGSEFVKLKNSKGNVNITPLGPVNDVSAIRDNTEREYSAMQEYEVGFVMEAAGFTSMKDVSGRTDNHSGGAPENLRNADAGYFEGIELEKNGGTHEQCD